MPWTCDGCRTVVKTDDVATCPECGAKKEAWSFVAARTRALVVSAKRFDLLTGVDAQARRPGDGGLVDVEVVPAQVAWALGRAEARALSAQGLLPPSRHVLFVRLFPKGAKDLGVKVAVEFETREVEEVAVPCEESPPPEVLDVPLLLVAGEDVGHDLPSFPGLKVLDVTEETEGGHAPSIEVAALKRPPRRVPISLGVTPRLVHDASGAPLASLYVTLGREEEGRVVVEERCFTDPDGRLGVPQGEVGWQAGPPAVLARRPEGQVVRLHWAYGFETDEQLAALPPRAWSEVTIADEVRLRPSRPRGRLHVRVLEPGAPPTPLASAACRLNGPRGAGIAPLEVTTGADGVLALDDLVHGLWRLETPAGAARIEPGAGGDAPLDVVVSPEEDPAPPPDGPPPWLAVAPSEPVDAPDEVGGDRPDDGDEDDDGIPDRDELEGDVGVLSEDLFRALRGLGGGR